MDEKRKSCGGHGQRHLFFFVCFFFVSVVMVFVCSHGSSVGENQIWFADMTYYIIKLHIYISIVCVYVCDMSIYTYRHTCVQKHPCNAAAIQCSETSPGKCFRFFSAHLLGCFNGEGPLDPVKL